MNTVEGNIFLLYFGKTKLQITYFLEGSVGVRIKECSPSNNILPTIRVRIKECSPSNNVLPMVKSQNKIVFTFSTHMPSNNYAWSVISQWQQVGVKMVATGGSEDGGNRWE